MPVAAAPGLVIFDCDGVLVDSEPISVGVLLDLLKNLGGDLSVGEAYDKFLGRSFGTVRDLLRVDYGIELTDAHVAEARAEVFRRFREELKPVPGAPAAIREVGHRICVASSSQPDRIRLSLSLTGLSELFEPHIFSAAMVARGKPAPDLFRHAARAMGAEPARCVVVEDSPAGVRAAQAAGMPVIAFCGGTHAAPAGLPDALARLDPTALISDMADLPRQLRAILPPPESDPRRGSA